VKRYPKLFRSPMWSIIAKLLAKLSRQQRSPKLLSKRPLSYSIDNFHTLIKIAKPWRSMLIAIMTFQMRRQKFKLMHYWRMRMTSHRCPQRYFSKKANWSSISFKKGWWPRMHLWETSSKWPYMIQQLLRSSMSAPPITRMGATTFQWVESEKVTM
jgi:hypothetical protein